MIRSSSSRSIFTAREPQRIRLGLGHVQRFVQKIGQPVQFLDRSDDRLGLVASERGQRHLQLSANRRQRAAQIVRQRIGNRVQLVHRILDAVEHVIQRQRKVADFVAVARSSAPWRSRSEWPILEAASVIRRT